MNTRVVTFLSVCALCCASRTLRAQGVGDELKQSVSGGFLYAIPASSGIYNSVPGFSVNYAYRIRPWLALEAGLENAIHPAGGYTIDGLNGPVHFNYNDQLFQVPFGVRFSFSPPGGKRLRLSAGFGGAFFDDHYSGTASLVMGSSNQTVFGIQGSAAADLALSDSGRFRLGVRARYYYFNPQEEIIHTVTIGPTFTYSFH